jgi:hypothetical protein
MLTPKNSDPLVFSIKEAQKVEMAVQGATMVIMAATAMAEEESADAEQAAQSEDGGDDAEEDDPPPPPAPSEDVEESAVSPAPEEPAEPAVSPIAASLKPAPLELDHTPKIYKVKKGRTGLTLEVTPMSVRLMNGKKLAENLMYEKLQGWQAGMGELIITKVDGTELILKTSDGDEIAQGVTDMAMALAAAQTPQGEAPAKKVHGFSPAIGTQNLESPESSPAAGEVGGVGAKLKPKDVKKGIEVQLAEDRSQKGKVLKKAGKNAQVDFGGEQRWVPFVELELSISGMSDRLTLTLTRHYLHHTLLSCCYTVSLSR